MDAEHVVACLLAGPPDLQVLAQPLPDAVAATVVARLKQEADRHYWINANRSLALADLLVRIGQARVDCRQTALGLMTRADSLRFLGRIADAWNLFDRAAQLFYECDDAVGWARTRIGRLLCCVELNRVTEALADAERAREIFVQHGEHERLLALYNNTAMVYDMLGQHQQAIALYDQALVIAKALGERGIHQVGLLHIDRAIALFMLGELGEAEKGFESARTLFEQRSETRGVALAQHNLGHIALLQGQYRRALQLLYAARELYLAEQLPVDATHVDREVVECYLLLNRYAEARDLAQVVLAAYETIDAPYRKGLVLLHLASAEAELGDLEAAQQSLEAAEPIFRALDATPLVATIHVRRGHIALRQGDTTGAAHEALIAADHFKTHAQQVDEATATLLHAQALFAAGDVVAALRNSRTALRIAQTRNIPPLRYSASLLLGQIAEAQGQFTRAQRRYAAAVATVERVQRDLTITLRPGFLADKDEALRRLFRLHMHTGKVVQAFETLERTKAQAWTSYLANREQLRWAASDPRSQALLAELNELRQEHQWWYRLTHAVPHIPSEGALTPNIDVSEAQAEVVAREQRMRVITEHLYLQGNGTSIRRQARVPQLSDVQQRLDAGTMLIEFYNDGTHVWAFTVDQQTLQAHALPVSVAELDRLLAQVQVNFAAALGIEHTAPIARNLRALAHRLLQRLYAALIAPLSARLIGRKRLIIVPFGALHYLPFHLLHTGTRYLIESYEVAMLPAAALLTRDLPNRPPGARILAHTWDGRLPQTLVEAELVQRVWGGNMYQEGAAQREVLAAAPTQILHIAAHGKQRLDQPDLSYIQLADGQLYTDDLLQHDLSYELVTLSACETGRAQVAGGDELIGLGRGFLYAGAGTLVASLWPVADNMALHLMAHFYAALQAGVAKAEALQTAQCVLLAEQPHVHPATWGAFQLIGDAGRLSPQVLADKL